MFPIRKHTHKFWAIKKLFKAISLKNVFQADVWANSYPVVEWHVICKYKFVIIGIFTYTYTFIHTSKRAGNTSYLSFKGIILNLCTLSNIVLITQLPNWSICIDYTSWLILLMLCNGYWRGSFTYRYVCCSKNIIRDSKLLEGHYIICLV